MHIRLLLSNANIPSISGIENSLKSNLSVSMMMPHDYLSLVKDGPNDQYNL
jgi:hypothetical protein